VRGGITHHFLYILPPLILFCLFFFLSPSFLSHQFLFLTILPPISFLSLFFFLLPSFLSHQFLLLYILPPLSFLSYSSISHIPFLLINSCPSTPFLPYSFSLLFFFLST
jgi:hypothetical protein